MIQYLTLAKTACCWPTFCWTRQHQNGQERHNSDSAAAEGWLSALCGLGAGAQGTGRALGVHTDHNGSGVDWYQLLVSIRPHPLEEGGGGGSEGRRRRRSGERRDGRGERGREREQESERASVYVLLWWSGPYGLTTTYRPPQREREEEDEREDREDSRSNLHHLGLKGLHVLQKSVDGLPCVDDRLGGEG